MRWQGRKGSTQVEDRRGFPGGGRGMAVGGCGTLILVLVISWLTGVDPLALLQNVEGGGGLGAPGAEVSVPSGVQTGTGAADDHLAEFASVVLADTEETWTGIFRAQGVEYRLPTLVLFRDAVGSACGFNAAAVGPFYCPADGKLYLDLSFFADLERRLGAPGDFAQAYVIAHEVGHHVQNLLGLADRVTEAQRRARSQEQVNELSVRMELQADCLAGVWGHSAAGRGILEAGDVEEGLRAAAAIGDDRMQHMAQGRISPESWTHGSSEMRVRWLREGLSTGDADRCDTFRAERL